MDFRKDLSNWWRGFFGTSADKNCKAIEILRQRYGEEMQGMDRLAQHADKMHYPQFRQKLFHISADKSKHAEWIGEKILALGGKLPEVVERRSSGENSWRYLQMDLAEEKRCADRLPEQIWRIESDHPDISKFLRGIFDAKKRRRQEITDMLMRSDGFALSFA